MVKKPKSHTPTPWQVLIANKIYDSDGEFIGVTENVRDAQFIAKAVNSHEKLIKSLKDLLAYVKDQSGSDHNPWLEQRAEELLKEFE